MYFITQSCVESRLLYAWRAICSNDRIKVSRLCVNNSAYSSCCRKMVHIYCNLNERFSFRNCEFKKYLTKLFPTLLSISITLVNVYVNLVVFMRIAGTS